MMGRFRRFSYALISLAIFAICLNGKSFSQIYDNIYRPAKPDWQQLETPRFRIIYQKGEESAANQTAHILEEQYPHVQSLVGGSLSGMPVVLNSKNDRSNGYVSTLHFRIEVEVPRMKGNRMNPSDGNWLNTVMPHELVHALHLNVLPLNGLSGFINIFSPDMARNMHFAAPLGMLEGIAVFHESHHNYGIGGRGNHPYFQRRHDAIFNSRDRWSLSQSLMPPAHTYPFDRHYVGGHSFIHWLQYEYGMEITKNTIRFVSRWPFLGYGSALWYHTGKRPSQLQAKFESQHEERLARIEKNRPDSLFHIVPAAESSQNRNPFWISDSQILFYSSAYGKRPGFYSYDMANNEVSRVKETGSVEDYTFTLNPDRTRLLYARYHRHPFYHNHSRMNIHEVNLEMDTRNASESTPRSIKQVSSRQPVETDRVYAPVYGPDDTIWALKTHHENNILVRFTPEPDTVLTPENGYLVSLGFRPGQSDSLFLLGNKNGMQGLWLIQNGHWSDYNDRPPDIAFDNAAIYNPAWHPDGNRLLFTSDSDGAMNLYEYDLEQETVWRLTNHPYGVLEGSYSPNGDKLAGIRIHENTHQLFWVHYDDLDPVKVSDNRWSNPPSTGPSPPAADNPDSLADDWMVSDYRTGIGWLRPRMIYPFFEQETNHQDHRFGLVFASGDVLRRNSYYGEISTSNNRFWYDFEYRFSGFYPGFRINTYHEPVETTNWLQRSQGIGLDVPFTYLFDQDTRTSSLSVIPGIDLQRQQIITRQGDGIGPTFERLRGTVTVTYQHRLQQNIRDVQPNTGWVLFTNTEWDFYTDFDGENLRALRAGIYRYLSFYLSGNRSLRVGIEGITQNRPYFDISGFYSRGFDDYILSGVNNATRFNTRYTIPLWHADRGSALLPFFVDRIYAVLFTDTLIPIRSQSSAEALYQNSRTLYGAGVRLQMRIFNIPFNIGVATVFEPTRDRADYFIGAF